MRSSKYIVSILGLGNVGRSILHELLTLPLDLEINIIDPSEEIAGSVLDLGHASMLHPGVRFTINNSAKLDDSDFIFHAAGVSIPKGHPREFAMYENVHITREIFRNYTPYKASPKIIVVSNPVDVIALHTWKYSGLPKENIIGTGTMLDSLRLGYLFRSALGDAEAEVNASVIGEHGEAMVPVLSHSFLNGLPVRERLPKPMIDDCIFECRNAAQRIKKTQGATHYAAARCAVQIMREFLTPGDRCYTLSLHHQDEKAGALFYSMPAKITARGLFKVKDFHLNADEKQGLELSISKIRQNALRFAEEFEKYQ